MTHYNAYPIRIITRSPTAYDKAYVFELKVSKTGTDADIAKCMEKGMNQAQRNHYAEKYHFDALQVYVVSVVFENEQRQLVAWRDDR